MDQGTSIDRQALQVAIAGVFDAHQSLSTPLDGQRFAEVCLAVYEELQSTTETTLDARALAGAVFRMTRTT